MARVFTGNAAKVEQWIGPAVQSLDDSFWVLLEFQVRSRRFGLRDIDCLVLRPGPNPNLTATILMTELKDYSRTPWPITGSWNGTWKVARNGTIESLHVANSNDANPLVQATNASDALSDVLKEHAARYLEPGRQVTQREIYTQLKSYPMLLMHTAGPDQVTIDETMGRRFGMWFTSVDDWISKVRGWKSTQTIALSHEEIGRLVGLLDLTAYDWPSTGPAPARPVTTAPHPGSTTASPPAPASHKAQRTSALPLTGEPDAMGDRGDVTVPIPGLAWLQGLHDWIRATEARLADMDGRQTPAEAASGRLGARPPEPRLTDDHIVALRSTIQGIAEYDGRRDFPTVLKVLSHFLGYDLATTNYDGFGRASAFFNAASRLGVIQFGPYDGPTPSIYLPEETIPASPPPIQN